MRQQYTILFEGPPLKLLQRLNEIATENAINTNSREWPKDLKWLIRRINTIKSNLQQELGITIDIKRNTTTNTSIIKIMKNDSGISGEHNLSPENESLSPYLENLSPDSQGLSPTKTEDLSTESTGTGDSGLTGEKYDIFPDKEDKDKDNSKGTPSSNTNDLIGFRKPFYYCKEHPSVQFIDYNEIIDHLRYSMVHQQST